MVSQETVEFVLQRDYPRQLTLPSGPAVTIRPLAAGDEQALLAYFRRIPALERGRYFRDDVADPTLIAEWCQHINPLRTLSLVAWDDDQIVADATLRREDEFLKSHVAELRLSVDPAYRASGVGHGLTLNLLDLANHLGFDWVDAEVLSHDADALELILGLAFLKIGVYPDHACDNQLGETHDVIVFTRQVKRAVPVDIGGSG